MPGSDALARQRVGPESRQRHEADRNRGPPPMVKGGQIADVEIGARVKTRVDGDATLARTLPDVVLPPGCDDSGKRR